MITKNMIVSIDVVNAPDLESSEYIQKNYNVDKILP